MLFFFFYLFYVKKVLLILVAVLINTGFFVSGNDVCVGKPNLTLINNPKSCSAFFTCYNNIALESTCPEGLYFNSLINNCENKTTYSCQDSPVVCMPGEPDEVTIHDNPGKCAFFIICIGDIALSVECPDNLVFNPETLNCDTLENFPCEDYVSPCEGKDLNLVSDPDDCGKYYKCNNGEATNMMCDGNLFFNETLQDCVSFADAQCEAPFGPCSGKDDESLIDDPEACDAFIMCYMGSGINDNCAAGENFNTETLMCDPDFTCDVVVEEICNGLEDGVFLNNPESCAAYFVCIGGKPVAGKCLPPNFFNATTSRCDAPGSVDCIDPTPNPLCVAAENGSFVANPLDCQSWYRCDDGQPFEGSCPSGFHFDISIQMCDYIENVNCQITTPNPLCTDKPNDKQFFEVPGVCDSYTTCNSDNQMVTFTCPADYWFNAEIQACDLAINVNCTFDPCYNALDGIYLNNPESCDGYFYCKDNTSHPYDCPDGFYFDFLNQSCSYKENVDCNL